MERLFGLMYIKLMQSEEERKKSYKRWAAKHRTKINENQRIWVAKNKKKALYNQRKSAIKYTYGLTWDEYQQLLKLQNNCCALCFKKFTIKNKPQIDHCHKSKKVRGLLHQSCNLLLAHAKENSQILLYAIDYLEATNR